MDESGKDPPSVEESRGEMTRERDARERNEKREEGGEQVNGPESVKEGVESERGESENRSFPDTYIIQRGRKLAG